MKNYILAAASNVTAKGYSTRFSLIGLTKVRLEVFSFHWKVPLQWKYQKLDWFCYHISLVKLLGRVKLMTKVVGLCLKTIKVGIFAVYKNFGTTILHNWEKNIFCPNVIPCPAAEIIGGLWQTESQSQRTKSSWLSIQVSEIILVSFQ